MFRKPRKNPYPKKVDQSSFKHLSPSVIQGISDPETTGVVFKKDVQPNDNALPLKKLLLQSYVKFKPSPSYREKSAIKIQDFDASLYKLIAERKFNSFNPSLSTIHYLIHEYPQSQCKVAAYLGFSSLYSLVATLKHSDYAGKVDYEKLLITPLDVLREELGECYSQPLKINKNFIRFNYSLKELKLHLEKEISFSMVMANLGEASATSTNVKLRQLASLGITINLQKLRSENLQSLMENSESALWELKLYKLFSSAKIKKSFPNTSFSFYRLESEEVQEEVQMVGNNRSLIQPSSSLWRPYCFNRGVFI